jgi:hypothetical protein
MNSTENRIMTLDELRDCARQFQELLRLQDWRLDLKIVRGPHRFAFGGHAVAMTEPDNGQSFVNRHQKLAMIKLIDPLDYCDEYQPQDMLRTLIHELLHLHVESFMPDDKPESREKHIAAECALNLIAGALAAQRRELWKLQNATAQ